jgi:hypothetical protein
MFRGHDYCFLMLLHLQQKFEAPSVLLMWPWWGFTMNFLSLGSRFICKYAPKYFPITVVFEDEGHLNSDGCYGEFGTACTFAAHMSLLMAIYIFQFCKLFHLMSACRIMPICSSERKNLYMPAKCSLLHGLHSTNRRLGPVSPFLEAQRWMNKLTTPHDSEQ